MDIDMDKISIDTIEWDTQEYLHKSHSNDWFWTIGLVAFAGGVAAIWFKSYVFAIFILLSGASVIMFSIREPKDLHFIISKKGISAGRDFFPWNKIKSFNIKSNDDNLTAKLLIETTKHFLPIYTLSFPKEYRDKIQENLLKLVPPSDINESQSMLIADKIGF